MTRLLNEFEVAEQLTLSVSTMRRWRLVNQGPRWIKLGSSVRYRQEDIASYLDGLAKAADERKPNEVQETG